MKKKRKMKPINYNTFLKVFLITILLLGQLGYTQDLPPTDDPELDNDLPPTDDPEIAAAPIDSELLFLVIAGFVFAGKIYYEKHKNHLYDNKKEIS